MPKFHVGLRKQTFYHERSAFAIDAVDEETAKKKAIKHARKNDKSITWEAECVTSRPRPIVEVIVLAPEDAEVVDCDEEETTKEKPVRKNKEEIINSQIEEEIESMSE